MTRAALCLMALVIAKRLLKMVWVILAFTPAIIFYFPVLILYGLNKANSIMDKYMFKVVLFWDK